MFGVHGNLKSPNCLVDSRWVVKVSDFGCQSLLQKTSIEDRTEYAAMRGKPVVSSFQLLLWIRSK